MKKTLAILAITPLVLSSCFFNRTETPDKIETPPTPNPTEVSSGVTSVTPSPVSPDVEKNIVSKGDTVGVDYVGTLEDGTIFDSSIEEFAKKTKNYTPGGREYKPLSFSVGAGQMIKGFDAGVVGMKLGEKKTITIAPADAYGEAFKEQEVPAKYFQNVFTETVPRENFKDTVVQTVPVSALWEKGKGLKVGETIEAGSTKAKVTKIEGDNVTVAIDNKQNPFYGKKMAVGLRATLEGNTVTVKKLTNTEVTLEVENRASPFYGKTIKVGMEGELPNKGGKMKVLKVGKDTLTIGVPNTHELAGKTLKFDVEIKSIK